MGHPLLLICRAWRKQGLCPDSLGTEECLGPASGLRPGGCWAPAQGQLGLRLRGVGGTRGALGAEGGPPRRGTGSCTSSPGPWRQANWSGRCTPHTLGDPGPALNPTPAPASALGRLGGPCTLLWSPGPMSVPSTTVVPGGPGSWHWGWGLETRDPSKGRRVGKLPLLSWPHPTDLELAASTGNLALSWWG